MQQTQMQLRIYISCVRDKKENVIFIANIHVLVKKEKAHFVKPIRDVDVMEQEDARFETTVTAKPEPTVEWFV